MQVFIKRVVGLPGDRIAMVAGQVLRNGQKETEPYTVQCAGAPSCEFPSAVTIPAGNYFVLGDNRPDSDDSRFWGPVPQADILGVVVGCRPANAHCSGA